MEITAEEEAVLHRQEQDLKSISIIQNLLREIYNCAASVA